MKPTNHSKALDLVISLREQFKETDTKIMQMIEDKKINSGVYFVHHNAASHLQRLRDKVYNEDKITNWDLIFFAEQIPKDLEKAREFVARIEAGDIINGHVDFKD